MSEIFQDSRGKESSGNRPILLGKLLLLNVTAMLVAIAFGTVWQVSSYTRENKADALVELKEFVSAIEANIVSAAWRVNKDTMQVLLESIGRQPGVSSAHYFDASLDAKYNSPTYAENDNKACARQLAYDFSAKQVYNQPLGAGELFICFNDALVPVESHLTVASRQFPLVFIILLSTGLISLTIYQLVVRPLHGLSNHLKSGRPIEAFERGKYKGFNQSDEIDNLIFELKKRTKEMQEERAIVDLSMPEAQGIIVQTDAQLKIIRYNEGLLAITGPIQDDTYLSDHFDADLRSLQALQKVKCKNGRSYEIRSVQFKSSEQGVILFMLRDLTKAEEQQSAAIRDSKMAAIGVLASGVAHDFNNILGGILGNAEFLREEVLSADGRKSLAIIVDHSERGASLSSQLLSFARQKSQKRETFEVNDVISNLLNLAKPILAANIKLTTHLVSGGTVRVDRGLLESALMNLVINARDSFSGAVDGVIKVSTRSTRRDSIDYLEISVSDNGCGISEEVLSRMREPFFTTKRRGEGSGLGIAMVSGFAEQSAGFLEVQSKLRHGTKVSLILPISTEAVAPPLKRPIKSQSELALLQHKSSVLVVEDEPVLRKIMKILLVKGGFDVTAVGSITQIMKEKLNAKEFDLVVCDVILEDGLATNVKKAFAEVGNMSKFAYISGNFPVEIVEALGGSDNIATLDKPFKNDDFIRFVTRQIEKNRTQTVSVLVPPKTHDSTYST